MAFGLQQDHSLKTIHSLCSMDHMTRESLLCHDPMYLLTPCSPGMDTRCVSGPTWMEMVRATRLTSLSSLFWWKESMMHCWGGPLTTKCPWSLLVRKEPELRLVLHHLAFCCYVWWYPKLWDHQRTSMRIACWTPDGVTVVLCESGMCCTVLLGWPSWLGLSAISAQFKFLLPLCTLHPLPPSLPSSSNLTPFHSFLTLLLLISSLPPLLPPSPSPSHLKRSGSTGKHTEVCV